MAAMYFVIGLAAAVGAGALLQSCGSGPDFRIQGFVDGLGTQNLKVVYYADGAFQQVSAPAVDGNFTMLGHTDEPTLVWIYNNAGSLVGRLVVDGGDNIAARFAIGNPLDFKVKGNDESELLAKFMSENSELITRVNRTSAAGGANRRAGASTATEADINALNAAVAEFVKNHSGSVAASAVLVEFYNMSGGREALGRELLEMIDSDERPASIVEPFIYSLSAAEFPDSLKMAKHSPLRKGLRLLPSRGDSLITLTTRGHARTVLMFTDDESRRCDSVSNLASVLRTLAGVRLADISLDNDTSSWRRSLPDPGQPDIERFWSLGGPASPGIIGLKISRLPFFVVADSTSRLIYRGTSVKAAQYAARH